MTRLHVNVDHVATLRQARGVEYPDPVPAMALCEMAGAAGITIHLREDRRHICDRDLELARQVVTTVLNMEMAATDEMIVIARTMRPDICTLVPEKREERTTEGGLAVAADVEGVSAAVGALHEAGIRVSLFIDPAEEEILASKRAGADMVELHTGDFCNASGASRAHELQRIVDGARTAAKTGMAVAAGHGLHYHNVAEVAAIPEIVELNIGHSIISRAVYVGIEKAVIQMLEAMGGAVILGIGIDVCPIERIQDILSRHGDIFAKRVYTERERAHAEAGPAVHPERLAARFAAKEAAIKALGAPEGLRWRDMEVVNDEAGAPSLKLAGRAAERAEELGVTRSWISISHAGGVAVAVVVLEGGA